MLSEIGQTGKVKNICFHSYVGYKQEKQTKTRRHRQQREAGVGIVKGKGGQIYGDRRFDFGGGHTVQ